MDTFILDTDAAIVNINIMMLFGWCALLIIGFGVTQLYIKLRRYYRHTEHARGFRKPGTEQGAWQGAFVAAQDKHGNVVVAKFEDNVDYIGYVVNWPLACYELWKAQKSGYTIPMTRRDMKMTAGI